MKEHKKDSAWFDTLYKEHYHKKENIPWAKMEPNPFLQEYLQNHLPHGKGRAIVIGCGLGDDAVALSNAGFDVTAIDVSEHAIALCEERFDGFGINFLVQDIFELPQSMLASYDFVFEAYTIQSMPLRYRDKMITAISSLVAANGLAFTVAHGKNEGELFKGPPWPLERNELRLFTMKNMEELEFSIFEGDNNLGSLMFRAIFKKNDNN